MTYTHCIIDHALGAVYLVTTPQYDNDMLNVDNYIYVGSENGADQCGYRGDMGRGGFRPGNVSVVPLEAS